MPADTCPRCGNDDDIVMLSCPKCKKQFCDDCAAGDSKWQESSASGIQFRPMGKKACPYCKTEIHR